MGKALNTDDTKYVKQMHKMSIKAGGKDCVGKDFWGDENLITEIGN